MHGGHAFVEACKVHTNVPVGDIVCTTSGDLQCQYVIHAISCDWDKTNKTKEVKQWLQTNIVSRLSFSTFRKCKIIKTETEQLWHWLYLVYRVLNDKKRDLYVKQSSSLCAAQLKRQCS